MISTSDPSLLHIRFEQRFGPEFFKRIPTKPGVFWFLNPKRQMLLVAPSLNLQLKIFSFRQNLAQVCQRQGLELIRQIHEINWTECQSFESASLVAKEIGQNHKAQYQLHEYDPNNFYFINVKAEGHLIKLSLSHKGYGLKDSFGAFKGPSLMTSNFASLCRCVQFLGRGNKALHWPRQITGKNNQNPFAVALSLNHPFKAWNWQHSLENLLLGEDSSFVDQYRNSLDEALQFIDQFTYQWLNRDLNSLEKLYNQQAKKNAKLRQTHQFPYKQIAPEWLAPFLITRRISDC